MCMQIHELIYTLSNVFQGLLKLYKTSLNVCDRSKAVGINIETFYIF